MSTNDPRYNGPPPQAERPDITQPIARAGEQQFACILRNRSGQDAGCIDYGLRSHYIREHLSDGEKQAICDTAFTLYQNICEYAGKRARNDTTKEAP